VTLEPVTRRQVPTDRLQREVDGLRAGLAQGDRLVRDQRADAELVDVVEVAEHDGKTRVSTLPVPRVDLSGRCPSYRGWDCQLLMRVMIKARTAPLTR
jgi:hypothetical protein